MKFQISKAWQLGLLVLLLNVIISELTLVIDEYVYHRAGINKSYLSVVLWLFPLFAAYIASYYSDRFKMIYGLSYVLLFPLMATVGHYLNGLFGNAVDFVGMSGAMVFFKVHLAISSVIISVGTIIGVVRSMRSAD